MLIIRFKAPLQGSRPSVNAALILRSFGEAHLRRVHASTHIHTHTHAGTQQHTGSIPERRQRWVFFGVTIRRQTHWLFFHGVSRLLPDCVWPPQNGPGPRRAVRILRPATQIHLAPAEGPLADRAASSCSQPRDRMSRSSEESHSVRGGGSDSDLKMASSSNTSPEGGPPPPLHQNRIRQVGVRPLQPRSSLHRPAQSAA